MNTLLIAVAILFGSSLDPGFAFQSRNLYERIVGGSDAKDGEFPYQASITTRFYAKNRFYCAASIISEEWLLSAAQCFTTFKPMYYYAAVGSARLNITFDEYRVKDVIFHPKFNHDKYLNDIAVVKLERPITFNHKVKPIELAKVTPQRGSNCITIGWGNTQIYDEKYPNNLQKLKVKTMSRRTCRKLHANLGFIEVTPTNLCIDTPMGQGACEGDTGGPLVCKGVIAGIVSMGVPCGLGYPDVYTDVAKYRSWIKKVTGV